MIDIFVRAVFHVTKTAEVCSYFCFLDICYPLFCSYDWVLIIRIWLYWHPRLQNFLLVKRKRGIFFMECFCRLFQFHVIIIYYFLLIFLICFLDFFTFFINFSINLTTFLSDFVNFFLL